MSEIPEDIKSIAAEVARSGNSFFEREDNIAQAILAERNRCAKIAEAAVSDDEDWDTSYWNQCANNIAFKIRRP